MDEDRVPVATPLRQTREASLATSEATREKVKSSRTTETSGVSESVERRDAENMDADSELSEPDSNIGLSPGLNKALSAGRASLSENSVQESRNDDDDEPPKSHYPKRKRNSIYQNLNDYRLHPDIQLEEGKARTATPMRRSSKSTGHLPGLTTPAAHCTIIGHWRDSPVPQEARKHAVIGFIDVRDRLRTRIQTHNNLGEPISEEYPLSGPGASWLTFDKIAFLPHLVGLDQYEVKEYVRIRRDAASSDEPKAEREKAEMEAVNKAKSLLKENPNLRNPNSHPIIAHGQELPAEQNTSRPESKRRRTSGYFAPIASSNDAGLRTATLNQPTTVASRQAGSVDPLDGTRPTRILIGYWKGSNQPREEDRHAVYGILSANEMFRVKLTRETRDGRSIEGNFPEGPGALWITYDEVVLEPHLKDHNKQEIKEYCRVRQWQIDKTGLEKDEDRPSNLLEAAKEAKRRIALTSGTISTSSAPQPQASASLKSAQAKEKETSADPPIANGDSNDSNTTLRQSRRHAKSRKMKRAERAGGHSHRQLVDIESQESTTRVVPNNPNERVNALARRQIERVEAAQGRADRNAPNRERAARAAAMDAANAAALSAISANGTTNVNGTSSSPRLTETEHMQRLNAVWARQESLRARAGTEDAKIYDGVKYERKTTGPFVGKLVSQGHIINIDGEDYVEYRVLTKPSFF